MISPATRNRQTAATAEREPKGRKNLIGEACSLNGHDVAALLSDYRPPAVVADMLVSAINQNTTKWHLSPAMTEIEKRVIAWAAEFLDLPHHGIMQARAAAKPRHALDVLIKL